MAILPDSVPILFWQLVETRGEAVTIWRKQAGIWESITWGEYGRWARDLGQALIAAGLQPGEAVAILSQTRAEWTLIDMAIICVGGVTTPVYHSVTAPQAHYILHHSASRLVFVEDQEQLDKVLEVREELPELRQVVVVDKYQPLDLPGVVSLEEFRQRGRQYGRANPGDFSTRLQAVQPGDVISLIYTSGTTGPPKATLITSRNVLAIIQHLPNLIGLNSEDLTIAYLPLAHIAERVVGHFMKLAGGNQTVFAEGIDELTANLRQTGPTVMFGTPRIFEKFYARISTAIEDATHFQKWVYGWAKRVGRKRSEKLLAGQKLLPGLKLQNALAHFLVFRKIQDLFGGKIRFMISGGAPIAPQIIHYFHWIGMDIYEVYGLTESTGLISMNRPGAVKIGSVGPLFPETEVKIAADGEICSRGPQMCPGYYKDSQATAELLETDGDDGPWLHTGDVGYLDDEGYLYITDRKKDIIITAGGKNVAPQNIENLLKTSPYISQSMVYGDRRPYLIALITLDEDEITKFARDRRILYQDLADLTRQEAVVELVGREVQEKNRHLASYETIKKFRILEEDFDQDKDEITPTLKVKRKIVTRRYQDLLNRMYG